MHFQSTNKAKEIDLESLGVEYCGKVKIWGNKCQIKVGLARFSMLTLLMMTLGNKCLQFFPMSIFCLPHRERRRATFVHLYPYSWEAEGDLTHKGNAKMRGRHRRDMTTSQEMLATIRSWKRQGPDLPQNLPTSKFQPVKLISESRPPQL